MARRKNPDRVDSRTLAGFHPIKNWFKWQLPYVASAYARIPVTFTRRVLLNPHRGDLPERWFWDKWGFLKPELSAGRLERPVWVHLNSGGEVIIGAGLLKRLGVEEGPYVLSTESYDGYSLICRRYGPERAFFSPWDTARPISRVLRLLRPRALVFVYSAYLPVLLREARRAGVKTALVNGFFTRDVQMGNPFMQRAMALRFYRELDAIAVQREADYDAALRWGIPKERLCVTGDIYADLTHLRLSEEERLSLRRELGLTDGERVVMIGSTHLKEESVVLEALRLIRQAHPNLRFIVAPRQIQESEEWFGRLCQARWRVVRWSRRREGISPESLNYDVLLVDTFGELGRFFGAADVAYIGASLVPLNERRAGHNVLEPLAHGVIPLFGPHMSLWKHMVERLLQVEPALQVDSPDTLAKRVSDVLERRLQIEAVQQLGGKLITEQAGAVDRTLGFLRERVWK